MYFTNISYNPDIDISPVIPNMAIDLIECLMTGYVPSTGVEPEYNGIDDFSYIAGRVEDVFDAIEHARNLSSAMASAESKVNSNVSNPVVNPEVGKSE